MFEHVIRVGWADCDPANIAYTGRIPCFALEAIDAWWEHLLGGGWFQMERDRDIGTPFVRIEIDLMRPTTPRHRLHCAVAPVRRGTTSLTFRVEGRQDGQLCFAGRFTCVMTKASEFRKEPFPQEILDRIDAALVPDAANVAE